MDVGLEHIPGLQSPSVDPLGPRPFDWTRPTSSPAPRGIGTPPPVRGPVSYRTNLSAATPVRDPLPTRGEVTPGSPSSDPRERTPPSSHQVPHETPLLPLVTSYRTPAHTPHVGTSQPRPRRSPHDAPVSVPSVLDDPGDRRLPSSRSTSVEPETTQNPLRPCVRHPYRRLSPQDCLGKPTLTRLRTRVGPDARRGGRPRGCR